MAKLQSGDLSLEIKYNSYEPDWIVYEVKFSWKDEVIINDGILKRGGRYWGRRPRSTFLANDYERDQLIDTIKRVLDTNEPDYWQPIEPDITIAIYPFMDFPFGIKSHWEFVNEEDRKLHEEMQQARGECFTIIALADVYNFKDSGAYSGNGISLHLITKRERLEKFAADLESEYKDLKIEHDNLLASSVEHVGQNIDAMSLNSDVAGLLLFLEKNGPKEEKDIIAGIPGFSVTTLGKASELQLIDYTYPRIWLTGAGQSLATVLARLQRSF